MKLKPLEERRKDLEKNVAVPLGKRWKPLKGFRAGEAVTAMEKKIAERFRVESQKYAGMPRIERRAMEQSLRRNLWRMAQKGQL